ncbi:hypothetical protein [Aquipuribacter sp. MA13-6]|uniref:hypothetical protein n=1 Tax=unclassified Aquipuribacter TaxID=2635084 RepID=UPI003EEECF9C
MTTPRHLLVPVLALALGAGLLAPAATAAPAPPAGATVAAVVDGPLANLDHLDFLGDTVAPPAQEGHTTYRLDEEPGVGVLWTYADARGDGVFERVGGGPYDPATDTWGQGAFNADDLTRAAVVYLRHWQQTGDLDSRDSAYQLLRGTTYLQTVTGPDAGNVVLWMQPDGTLEPSPEPVELPDPSDSDASYWLARTVWALGEGYAAFAEHDPAFAAFLRERMDLSLAALERQVLDDHGTWEVADGRRVPGWLIVDGADASAEAVLGLAAYVDAAPADDPVTGRAEVAMAQLAEGIAAMSGGDAQQWPYGAIVQWTHSQSFWHAWASQMPAALAVASDGLDRPDLLPAAVTDSAVFTPHLLTSTGMVNGWLPVPGDLTQIAYGVDSRVQSLVAVADAADRPSLDRLAGLTASWYFGANRAGEPMYVAETGVTYDGLSAAGDINRNSGAESAIHGLLTMLALDARPDVAALAQASTELVELDGVQVVEAESATGRGATVVTPPSAWTGESQWSAGAYLSMAGGSSVTWAVPVDDQPRLVSPVVDLVPDRRAPVLTFSADGAPLGRLLVGSGGEQGVTEAPGAILPTTLRGVLAPGGTEVTAGSSRRGADPARVDALLLKPFVSRLVTDGPDGGTVLLHSAADSARTVSVDAPGAGPVVVEVHDATGALVRRTDAGAGPVPVQVLPGGFTLVTG